MPKMNPDPKTPSPPSRRRLERGIQLDIDGDILHDLSVIATCPARGQGRGSQLLTSESRTESKQTLQDQPNYLQPPSYPPPPPPVHQRKGEQITYNGRSPVPTTLHPSTAPQQRRRERMFFKSRLHGIASSSPSAQRRYPRQPFNHHHPMEIPTLSPQPKPLWLSTYYGNPPKIGAFSTSHQRQRAQTIHIEVSISRLSTCETLTNDESPSLKIPRVRGSEARKYVPLMKVPKPKKPKTPEEEEKERKENKGGEKLPDLILPWAADLTRSADGCLYRNAPMSAESFGVSEGNPSRKATSLVEGPVRASNERTCRSATYGNERPPDITKKRPIRSAIPAFAEALDVPQPSSVRTAARTTPRRASRVATGSNSLIPRPGLQRYENQRAGPSASKRYSTHSSDGPLEDIVSFIQASDVEIPEPREIVPLWQNREEVVSPKSRKSSVSSWFRQAGRGSKSSIFSSPKTPLARSTHLSENEEGDTASASLSTPRIRGSHTSKKGDIESITSPSPLRMAEGCHPQSKNPDAPELSKLKSKESLTFPKTPKSTGKKTLWSIINPATLPPIARFFRKLSMSDPEASKPTMESKSETPTPLVEPDSVVFLPRLTQDNLFHHTVATRESHPFFAPYIIQQWVDQMCDFFCRGAKDIPARPRRFVIDDWTGYERQLRRTSSLPNMGDTWEGRGCIDAAGIYQFPLRCCVLKDFKIPLKTYSRTSYRGHPQPRQTPRRTRQLHELGVHPRSLDPRLARQERIIDNRGRLIGYHWLEPVTIPTIIVENTDLREPVEQGTNVTMNEVEPSQDHIQTEAALSIEAGISHDPVQAEAAPSMEIEANQGENPRESYFNDDDETVVDSDLDESDEVKEDDEQIPENATTNVDRLEQSVIARLRVDERISGQKTPDLSSAIPEAGRSILQGMVGDNIDIEQTYWDSMLSEDLSPPVWAYPEVPNGDQEDTVSIIQNVVNQVADAESTFMENNQSRILIDMLDGSVQPVDGEEDNERDSEEDGEEVFQRFSEDANQNVASADPTSMESIQSGAVVSSENNSDLTEAEEESPVAIHQTTVDHVSNAEQDLMEGFRSPERMVLEDNQESPVADRQDVPTYDNLSSVPGVSQISSDIAREQARWMYAGRPRELGASYDASTVSKTSSNSDNDSEVNRYNHMADAGCYVRPRPIRQFRGFQLQNPEERLSQYFSNRGPYSNQNINSYRNDFEDGQYTRREIEDYHANSDDSEYTRRTVEVYRSEDLLSNGIDLAAPRTIGSDHPGFAGIQGRLQTQSMQQIIDQSFFNTADYPEVIFPTSHEENSDAGEGNGRRRPDLYYRGQPIDIVTRLEALDHLFESSSDSETHQAETAAPIGFQLRGSVRNPEVQPHSPLEHFPAFEEESSESSENPFSPVFLNHLAQRSQLQSGDENAIEAVAIPGLNEDSLALYLASDMYEVSQITLPHIGHTWRMRNRRDAQTGLIPLLLAPEAHLGGSTVAIRPTYNHYRQAQGLSVVRRPISSSVYLQRCTRYALSTISSSSPHLNMINDQRRISAIGRDFAWQYLANAPLTRRLLEERRASTKAEAPLVTPLPESVSDHDGTTWSYGIFSIQDQDGLQPLLLTSRRRQYYNDTLAGRREVARFVRRTSMIRIRNQRPRPSRAFIYDAEHARQDPFGNVGFPETPVPRASSSRYSEDQELNSTPVNQSIPGHPQHEEESNQQAQNNSTADSFLGLPLLNSALFEDESSEEDSIPCEVTASHLESDYTLLLDSSALNVTHNDTDRMSRSPICQAGMDTHYDAGTSATAPTTPSSDDSDASLALLRLRGGGTEESRVVRAVASMSKRIGRFVARFKNESTESESESSTFDEEAQAEEVLSRDEFVNSHHLTELPGDNYQEVVLPATPFRCPVFNDALETPGTSRKAERDGTSTAIILSNGAVIPTSTGGYAVARKRSAIHIPWVKSTHGDIRRVAAINLNKPLPSLPEVDEPAVGKVPNSRAWIEKAFKVSAALEKRRQRDSSVGKISGPVVS